MRSFDSEKGEVGLGAVAGGVLAIAGGVAAAIIQARLQRRYERERERQQAATAAATAKADLVAAIRMVRYELTGNGAFISDLIGSGTVREPIQLRDTNYRSVQLVLQHGLPDQLRKALAEVTSVLLPLAITKVQAYHEACRQYAASGVSVTTLTGIRQNTLSGLQTILAEIQRVNQQLLDYLRTTLNAEP